MVRNIYVYMPKGGHSMPATTETAPLNLEDVGCVLTESAQAHHAQETRALCQPLFDLDLSPAKLAHMLGVSKALVSRWLHGTRPMTTEQVVKVFSYLLYVS